MDRMTAVYGRNSTVGDGWRQPVTWLRHSQQQSCADTVTGTVLQLPYVRSVWGTVNSPSAGKLSFCIAGHYISLLPIPAIQYNNQAVKQIPLKLQTCLFVPSLLILYIFFQGNCFMPGIYSLCLSSIMVNDNGQQRRLKDMSILTLHAVSICSYYILQLT